MAASSVPELGMDLAATRWPAPRLGVVVGVVLCAVLAGAAVATPEWWVPAAFLLAGVAVTITLAFHPRAALKIAFFLVVAAITKFRVREGTALLEGAIDAQVVFELASYAVIFAIVLVNVFAARERRQAPTWSTAEVLLGGYLVLALASTAWSQDIRVTVVRALQLTALYGLAYIAVEELGPSPALRTLTASVVAYVLLGACLALVFPWASYTYVLGLFSWFSLHPGVAGTCAATAALLLLAQAAAGDGPRRIRVLRWAAIAALSVIVVATHQRTPVLAFCAGALALGSRKLLRPWVAGLVLCAVCAVAIVGLRGLGASNEDVARPGEANPVAVYFLRGQTGEQFLGLTGRVELWGYIESLVRERPLLGYGYGASRSILLERFPWAGSAHSALLEVMLNLGLVGTLLIVWVVVRTLGRAFLSPFPSRGPGAWMPGAVLAVLAYLCADAVAGESFAGAPGYEVCLFFATAMAYDRWREVDGSDDV
jgi:O-antigen ligase